MHHLIIAARKSLFAIIALAVLWSSGCSEVTNLNESPLAGLTIGPSGSLQPEFSSTIDSYTATVASDASAAALTVVPEDTTTTVAINGVVIEPGQVHAVALRPPGSPTPVEIVTTSPNGRGSRYTVMVSRLESGNVNLSALSVSPGELKPSFSPDINVYSVDVDYPVENVIIRATKADPTARMSGVLLLDGGIASGEVQIPLTAGVIKPATLTIESGSFRIYTVTISRALKDGKPPPPGGGPPPPSTVSTLQSVTPSRGTIRKDGTTSYAVTVQDFAPLSVTVTKDDPNAVVTAAGNVIAAAGVPSGTAAIPQKVVPNPGGDSRGNGVAFESLELIVTAEDGVTKSKYVVSADVYLPPFQRY